MKLSAVKLETRSVALSFGPGEVLNVDYYPARFTRKVMDELNEIDRRVQDKQNRGAALEGDEAVAPALLLSRILAGWDLETEDGKPVKITPEFLADEMGYLNINRITRAIMESLDPNAGSGGAR
jgi:hypothetical protein